MTSTDTHSHNPRALRPLALRIVFVVAAAGAWAATIRWARNMGNGPGTMGLGWAGFVGVWAVMMTAMMLPAVWHETPRQSAGGEQLRLGRPIGFAIGYLSVWAAVGIAAFAIATSAGHLAAHEPGAATGAAAIIFAVCGLYQFSSAKSRALAHCRPKAGDPTSPPDERSTATMLRGVRQGGWCLGSSWALMALLIPFGVMNIAAMVLLLVAIYAERSRFPGRGIHRLTGVVSLTLVPLVLIDPWLAPGLHVAATSMRM